MSRKKMSEELETTEDVILNIEYNRLKNLEQKKPLFRLLCNTYGVSELWLHTGEGNMFDEVSPGHELVRYCADLSMGKDKYVAAAILTYSKLSEENKQVIDNYISELAKLIVNIDNSK